VAKKLPGLRRFEAARGVATTNGSEVPYQRVAEFTFDDVDALQAGRASDQRQAAANDISNVATGGVTIFIAEIDDEREAADHCRVRLQASADTGRTSALRDER
jgi:uncharacterized protein (TIGR02118 family)